MLYMLFFFSFFWGITAQMACFRFVNIFPQLNRSRSTLRGEKTSAEKSGSVSAG